MDRRAEPCRCTGPALARAPVPVPLPLPLPLPLLLPLPLPPPSRDLSGEAAQDTDARDVTRARAGLAEAAAPAPAPAGAAPPFEGAVRGATRVERPRTNAAPGVIAVPRPRCATTLAPPRAALPARSAVPGVMAVAVAVAPTRAERAAVRCNAAPGVMAVVVPRALVAGFRRSAAPGVMTVLPDVRLALGTLAGPPRLDLSVACTLGPPSVPPKVVAFKPSRAASLLTWAGDDETAAADAGPLAFVGRARATGTRGRIRRLAVGWNRRVGVEDGVPPFDTAWLALDGVDWLIETTGGACCGRHNDHSAPRNHVARRN